MSVREAVEELAPVVVRRQSASAIRHDSTLERIVSSPDGPVLWIHPIQTNAFDCDGPIVVHLVDRPLSFAARSVLRIDVETLGIRLADLQIRRRLRRAPRAFRGRTDLLLTAPSGVGDLLVLPVVDISSGYCAVRCTTPLADGDILHSVELVGDGGVLRRSSARVLESIPWMTQAGHREFRVRLALEPVIEFAEREYDTVDDPRTVRRILELSALLEVGGSIEQSAFRFRSADDDSVLVESEVPQIGKTQRWVEFELFAVRYECKVRLIEHRANLAKLSYPLFLRRRRRRVESRAVGHDLSVSFRNPVSATRETREVVDISQGGLRFDCQPSDVLWRDLVLQNAVLSHGDERTALGGLKVCFTDEVECGTAFADTNAGHSEPIGRLLMGLRQPALEVHDGSSFEKHLQLYRSSHLLMPFMEEQLASATDVAESWRRAHAHGDVCRTLARYEGGLAVASVTACMAWDGTWLGEHLAALKTRGGCTPGTLLMAFLDHVLLRPDCRWMAFFATVGNTKMNEIHERFAALTGTPDAMARHQISAWLFRGGLSAAPSPQVREIQTRDHVLLERAASRQMGGLVAAGLGFTREGIELPRVTKRLRQRGLHRSRRSQIVELGGTQRLAMVTERCSAGLCIPGILNGTWLIPLHFEVDGSRRAPARAAVELAVASLVLDEGEPCRLVFTDSSVPDEWMEEMELVHAFDAYVYVMNRAGLRRYAAHLAESYGTLNALRRPRSSANAS